MEIALGGLSITGGLGVDTIAVSGVSTFTGAVTMTAGLVADITGNLSGAVGSAAALGTQAKTDVQSALTSQGVTAARAAKLDNLDAAVSSREASGAAAAAIAAYDGPTNGELTAARNVVTAAITAAEGNIRGADDDTLKTVSLQLDGLGSVGSIANAVWTETASGYSGSSTMGGLM